MKKKDAQVYCDAAEAEVLVGSFLHYRCLNRLKIANPFELFLLQESL